MQTKVTQIHKNLSTHKQKGMHTNVHSETPASEELNRAPHITNHKQMRAVYQNHFTNIQNNELTQ